MRCVKCGSELKPGARFCSKCGAVNGPAGEGKKQPPGIRPASNGNRPSPAGQGGYPPPVPQKEKKPVALIAVLIVLVLCLVLSIGGLAAYKMGVFDSLLSGSRTEDTDSKRDRNDRDDDEDGRDEDSRDRDEDDEDGRDRDEDDEDSRNREEDDGAGNRGGTDTAESSPAAEEPATLPTMDPTMAATETPTMAQTTAAMPTLAGQGGTGVPAQMPAQGSAPANGSQDYILPDSSTRSLTYADISGLTKEQLRIARNEIYARHGRMFTTEELQNYFNSKSWYRGTISASSFSESMLSQLEKDNIKLIQERENALP